MAERLEPKLDADYRLWYNVPMCPTNIHPDFSAMLPHRGMPKAVSCERDGEAHKETYAWGDMGIVCPDRKARGLCAQVLAQRKLPLVNRLGSGDLDATSTHSKVMTVHARKGLDFSLAALPGVGQEPAREEDETEVPRVFYVAAARAAQRLDLGLGNDEGLATNSRVNRRQRVTAIENGLQLKYVTVPTLREPYRRH